MSGHHWPPVSPLEQVRTTHNDIAVRLTDAAIRAGSLAPGPSCPPCRRFEVYQGSWTVTLDREDQYMPEQRRRFSPPFKAEAVHIVIETGKPIAAVAVTVLSQRTLAKASA
jgi:hypothetical protein